MAMDEIDPIELELMRSLFEAGAEEMGITLQRTAYSANIKERRDFSCALFDARGELLAQAAHIPVHLGSMPASVEAVLERLGKLEEGDVAIVNDPYAGGTHLPDITVVSPIYVKGPSPQPSPRRSPWTGEEGPSPRPSPGVPGEGVRMLVGYAANRAHHADVGGVSPGSMTLSRHIDEEGVRIEPSLLYRRGVGDEELLKRIMDAVRTPEERRGDLEAQLAANHVGAEAMRRMVGRHGVEKVERYGAALLEYAQSFMIRAIREIPDGVWRFEDVMDDDGAGRADGTSGPVAIRVAIHVEGDRAVVDLRESAGQVAGCVNCPEAVTRSAVYYCFACLLDEDVPLNGGCFRNIEVLTRRGSVVHAVYPAAVVAGNVETSQRIVDVVLGALAGAMPGRVPAASCGTMSSVAVGGGEGSDRGDAARLSGDSPLTPALPPQGERGQEGTFNVQRSTSNAQQAGEARSQAGWTYYETVGGGSGAGEGFDGESCVQCHMTNTLNTPAEAIEMQYPLRVRRFERAAGSGGDGRWRGGDGIVREIEALAECEGTVLSDRRVSRAYGLGGGSPGSAGVNGVLRAGAREMEALGGKARFVLGIGDRLRIVTPGGGGWGDAGERGSAS